MSDQPMPGTPGESVPVDDGTTPLTDERPWLRWLLIGLGALLALLLIYFLFLREDEPEYEIDYEALEEILEEAAQPSPSPSPSPIPTVTVTASTAPSPQPTVTVTAPPEPSPTPSPTPTETIDPEPSPTPEPTETIEPEPSASPEPSPSPSPEPPDPAVPATEFGPGVYEVGTDVVAGTYRAATVVEWDAVVPCGWAVKHEGVTEREDLIGNPMVTGGIPTVTLVDGDLVGMRDCPTFELVDADELFDNAQATESFPHGVWLVGEDIAPGKYAPATVSNTLPDATASPAPMASPEASGPDDGCYYLITESLGNNFQTIVEYSQSKPGAAKVTLVAGQQFQSLGCGVWARYGN